MAEYDPLRLRKAFGSYMTGVTIVTAVSHSGEPVGFTANSFTSVSMNPPLLLVCPGNHLSSIDVFRACKHFAVNVLAEDQEMLSNKFAAATTDRFDQVNWIAGEGGAPIIADSLASFCCETHNRLDAGDHLILVGEVKEFSATEGRGLGYWKGGYFRLADERLSEARSGPRQQIFVGAIIERDGKILALESPSGLQLPGELLPSQTTARDGIDKYLAGSKLDADIGRIYSIYNQPDGSRQFMYFRATLGNPQASEDFIALSADQAMKESWEDEAVASMVKRYFEERNSNSFGLYVGDTETGEIHESG